MFSRIILTIVRFFRGDLEMTKRLIRERIERNAEGVFEDARAYEYVASKAELFEDMEKLSSIEKETIRIEMIKDMEEIRTEIYQLWGDLILRTAKFQVTVDSTWKIAVLAGLICLCCRLTGSALVLFGFALLVQLFLHTKRLFRIVMYVVSRSGFISDQLYGQYEEYGRREASLYLADYRHFSTNADDEAPKPWIFTSSHKTKAPTD